MDEDADFSILSIQGRRIKMRKKDSVIKILNVWRLIWVWLILHGIGGKVETQRLWQDVEAWNRVKSLRSSRWNCLSYYLVYYKEFRNLFLYRIRKSYLYFLIKCVFPPVDTLFLACPDIGGGLFIQHGFATIVAAKKVGINCWINQQVTVGYKGDGAPIIGDNVSIYCGAIVIGNITVDNNVTIAAGAVVVSDVPANTTIAGVPARIIREDIK